MGWFVSIGLFVAALITGNNFVLLTSGLFAIAGAISFASMKNDKDKKD